MSKIYLLNLFQKLLEKFQTLDKNKKNLLQYLFSLSEDQHAHYCESLLFLEEQKSFVFQDFEDKILKVLKNKIVISESSRDKKLKKYSVDSLFSQLGNVEKRDNQLKMAQIVEDTLVFNKKSVIEAPTGL